MTLDNHFHKSDGIGNLINPLYKKHNNEAQGFF